MNCETCNHKQHAPGFCKQCNCGESDLVFSKYGADKGYYDKDFNRIFEAQSIGKIREEREARRNERD